MPEPHIGELLPVNDIDWEDGNVVASEPLRTSAFDRVTAVGSFAKTCQAAYMLDKTVLHSKAIKSGTERSEEILSQAQVLNRALCALQAAVEEERADTSHADNDVVALSICISARTILYALYACNEGLSIMSGQSFALATEMQRISLDGCRSLCLSTIPKLAAIPNLPCPLTAHCMYVAAKEGGWFLEGYPETELQNALVQAFRGLKNVRKYWNVGGQSIAIARSRSIQC